jgi:hypothetical protein
MGSVAMGSFLMALFGLLRFLYELLSPSKTESEGCIRSWKKFCDCCCYLCVSFVFDWFNAGAYTYIHLYGEGYCPSAWNVVALRLKQPITTAIVGFMSAVIIWIFLVFFCVDSCWHYSADCLHLLYYHA